ncbi:hypothetical protein ACIBI4_33535 [Streptomyces sp. NPDC050418]|uniref:hypothetical protein n=1 Tax=Streptomyces sp. NPDC050418 TaxID=3365612 RepID=UPI0037A79C0F
MSETALNPEEIPEFTGNLEQLDKDATAVSLDGTSIAEAASKVDSTFQGLSAYYEAPEAEKLFASTKPVATGGGVFEDDLTTIGSALAAYATEIRPIVDRFKQLRAEAEAFRTSIADDDTWREDGDLVEENNNRRSAVNKAFADFQAAERTCHNKIVALVGGTPLKVTDGSKSKNQYGFRAEDLDGAKDLPWGDPVEESTRWYQIHEHAWDFGKGLVVDGVWGTLKGLWTLVNVTDWDSFSQAWTGLAKLATGIVITATPFGTAYWMAPEDKLPSWLRDSRTAVKETGKALVAWDQWGSNPARAAGATTFNVVTTVFTAGAGAGVSGAGKAGAISKAISAAGKAGRVIDPMTYVFKAGAATGLKVKDVFASLRMVSDGTYVRLADSTFEIVDRPAKFDEIPASSGITRENSQILRDPETGELVVFNAETLKIHHLDGSVKVDDVVPREASAAERAAEAGARQPGLVSVGARGGDLTAQAGDGLVRTGDGVFGSGARMDLEGNGASRGTDTGSTGGAVDNAAGGGARAVDGLPGGSVPDDLARAADNAAAQGSDGLPPGGDGTPGPHGGVPGDRSPLERPEHMRDGSNPYGPGGSLTQQQIEDIQVYRANTEPGYFEDFYRSNGTRKDLGLYDESGLTPPQLVQLTDGGPWVRAHDVPAPPKPRYLDAGYLRSGADNVVSRAKAKILQLAAEARHHAVKWDNLMADMKAETGAAHDLARTHESAGLWAEARGGYKESHAQMASKSEEFGETAAEHGYMAEHRPGFTREPLLGPKNGNDQFDQVWRHEDGRVVVIEAKGSPDADLGSRRLPDGPRVSQGSREYFLDIVRVMERRGETKLASALRSAMDHGKLEYTVVRGERNAGTYTGYQYRRFDISKGTLP